MTTNLRTTRHTANNLSICRKIDITQSERAQVRQPIITTLQLVQIETTSLHTPEQLETQNTEPLRHGYTQPLYHNAQPNTARFPTPQQLSALTHTSGAAQLTDGRRNSCRKQLPRGGRHMIHIFPYTSPNHFSFLLNTADHV